MNGFLASRKQLLLPALFTILFLALLLLLLNLGGVTAQDDPAGDAPRETPYYLPMIGGGASDASDIVPGEYIVVLNSAEVRAANGEALSVELFAADVASTYGGDILFTYETALEGFAAILPGRAVDSLAADPSVAWIEPNRVVRLDVAQSPATWGIDRIDQRNLPLNNTYNYNLTGAGVHAYIIDTGLLATHGEFAGRVGGGYTAISDGRGTTDCNGHGTHVAGTVGGTTWGVAKGATLHPVRVLGCTGSGTNAGVIAGINWVAANRVLPSVINMSLGGGASAALDTAVRNAVGAGVTVVVAAGNANTNACNSSPAREPQAITVGATTSGDARATYSNFGACLDIFAPGTSITSAWYTGNSATNSISGTSMASPHVAGAAALYLQAFPSAAPAAVVSALTTNATQNVVSNAGSGSPNRLLYVAFLNGSPVPTATNTPVPTNTTVSTNTPTSTPTHTPTNTPLPGTPTSVPANTPVPPAGTQLLANPGFETGRTVWTESSARGYQLICNTTSCGSLTVAPRGGAWLAWLAGANSETSEIRQPVSIPAGSTPVLTFWYRSVSSDWCGYDYAYANLIAGSTTIQLRRYNLCSSSNTNAWVQQQFSLAAYAGQTVTVVFRASADGSYVSSFYVDDVTLTTNGSAAAAPEADAPVEAPDGVLFIEPVAPAGAKPESPAAAEIFER